MVSGAQLFTKSPPVHRLAGVEPFKAVARYNNNMDGSRTSVLCTSHCLWAFCVGLCFGMH